MTVALIAPPAPRTDALAVHAYCLPVVRELSGPGRRSHRRPQLGNDFAAARRKHPDVGTRSISLPCRAGSNVAP